MVVVGSPDQSGRKGTLDSHRWLLSGGPSPESGGLLCSLATCDQTGLK